MAPRLRNPFKRNLHECEEVRALMSDLVDGELADEGRRRVERHVRFCRPCGRVLGNLRRTLVRLSRLSESPPPGSGDAGQVAERMRSTGASGPEQNHDGSGRSRTITKRPGVSESRISAGFSGSDAAEAS